LRSLFPRFNGREVKTIGDAFLAEFHSALEAAQCAIEIQRMLAKRNHDVPAARRIEVRIGIHIGDVVQRADGDVLGDGVNIASRIEPLAGANGICISVDVERQIRNTIEASLVKLGATELKHIQVPMELFRIVLPWEKQADGTSRRQEAHLLRPGNRRLLTSAAKRVSLRGALVVLAVAAGVGGWFFHQAGKGPKQAANPQTNTPTPPVASVVPGVTNQASLAVLPFLNLSSDKENEYFSDGITEHVSTALSQVKGLRVTARTSAFAFKGKNQDIRTIGRQLGVATVLEGSVQKAGNQLRISAQLINVADGYHLWATNYDRDFTNIFAIQSDVAQEVTTALKIQLLPGDRKFLQKSGTRDLEAYDLYLKGRFFWNKRTAEGYRKAFDYFSEAIRRDSNFALAYAGLADCYGSEVLELSPEEANAKTKQAVRKALEIDDSLAEAHTSLAFVEHLEGHWVEAEKEFLRAITLNPNQATAHSWYGLMLAKLGRHEQALAESKLAHTLDPTSLPINNLLGLVLYWARQYDEAIAVYEKTLELEPDFRPARSLLGLAYCQKRLYDRAIVELEKALQLSNRSPYALAQLGYAYGMAGRKPEALKLLDELAALSGQRHVAPYHRALIHLALGENDPAFEWLSKDDRSAELSTLGVEPMWDSLRSDARFAALLKKVGLQQ